VSNWKDYERWVARSLGTERIPVTGRHGPDVKTNRYFIDCKLRREVPAAYDKVLGAAFALGYQAVAVGDIVFMRLKHLDAPRIVEAHIVLPTRPIQWLYHIAQNTPSDRIPLVVMSKPRWRRRRSIALTYRSVYD